MRRLGGRFNTRDEADLKLEGASSFSKEDARVLGVIKVVEMLSRLRSI